MLIPWLLACQCIIPCTSFIFVVTCMHSRQWHLASILLTAMTSFCYYSSFTLVCTSIFPTTSLEAVIANVIFWLSYSYSKFNWRQWIWERQSQPRRSNCCSIVSTNKQKILFTAYFGSQCQKGDHKIQLEYISRQ